jgi:hypothetical protein
MVLLKWPPPSLERRLIVPVGVLLPPAAVSTTVTVHVVVPPAGTGFGEQLTVVEVERLVTVTV